MAATCDRRKNQEIKSCSRGLRNALNSVFRCHFRLMIWFCAVALFVAAFLALLVPDAFTNNEPSLRTDLYYLRNDMSKFSEISFKAGEAPLSKFKLSSTGFDTGLLSDTDVESKENSLEHDFENASKFNNTSDNLSDSKPLAKATGSNIRKMNFISMIGVLFNHLIR